MYIIDDTFFIKELVIPNSSEIDVSDTNNPFDYWIDTECRSVMKSALGSKNFKDFDFYMQDGNLTNAPEKWELLHDGTTYEYEGESYVWPGLIEHQGSAPLSLLAYYTYSKWFRYQQSQMTGMGEMYGSAANSSIASGTVREVKAWNNFIDWYQGDMTLFEIRTGITGTLSTSKDYQNTYYSSLLHFLYHNRDVYPDCALMLHSKKNRFSI